MPYSFSCKKGFTLIELSIVLVIIGLIVGGVLVGRDLINSAGVRAQLSQIEKYNQAANTFRVKYSYLPGDIPDPNAQQFGFAARGAYAGQGDGNGLLEGVWANAAASNQPYYVAGGENGMFWVDLSVARLIDGTFSTATPIGFPSISGTAIPLYFPMAKLGAYRGTAYPVIHTMGGAGVNFFSHRSVGSLSGSFVITNPQTILTPSQAFAIDTKMDDGLPIMGSVMALSYTASSTTNYNFTVRESMTVSFSPYPPTAAQFAVAASSCFDNGNVTGATLQYSVSGASNTPNCALGYRMQ